MDAILKWLSAYSLPVVILLAIGGAFLFVFQKVAEKAVAQAFDRHAKALELRLTRRSAFEEKLLTDRYAALVELNGRLDQFMTILNRIRSGPCRCESRARPWGVGCPFAGMGRLAAAHLPISP